MSRTILAMRTDSSPKAVEGLVRVPRRAELRVYLLKEQTPPAKALRLPNT